MGFPLAALKLRLKRFCEVLVARSSLGPHYIKNRHLSRLTLYVATRPLENLQAALDDAKRQTQCSGSTATVELLQG